MIVDDPRVTLVRTLDYSDLTGMIEETFGHPWDYQQAGSGEPIENDSQTYHEINPDDPDWTAESLYAIENWIAEGARSDDFDMSIDMFLAALHSRGKLAAGPITISVSW